jgi:hypothetical protein
MISPRCKFCGCTERRPCLLIVVDTGDGRPLILAPKSAIAVVPADGEAQLIPCAWLLEDVCTNPACVEKAYTERRPLAETIDLALQLGLIEEAA